MIISQQLIEKVNSIVADEALVLGVDERMPALLGKPAENVVVLRIELDIVLVQIIEQVLGAQNFGNLHQLVRVGLAVEEWLLPEDHGRKHGTEAPHVETVIVLLEVHEQLWSLEVSRRHANVVFGALVIELRQPPVDETELAFVVVDHDVVRLDIAVHDALGVTEIKRLQQLIYVVAHVVIGEFGVEVAEVGVVDVLEDEGGSLALVGGHVSVRFVQYTPSQTVPGH